MGGRWVDRQGQAYKDQGQTPNMQLAVFDFGGTLLVFEVRACAARASGRQEVPGQGGQRVLPGGGGIIGGKFFPKDSDKGESLPEVETNKAPGDVFRNFIDCVRSRKHEQLNADILDAHYSAALCHLGNISYRLGKQVPGSSAPEGFPKNPHVQESLDHCGRTSRSGWPGSGHGQLPVGRETDFDPATEKFVGNDDANALLTRKYREPFVVTEVA